MPSHTRRTHRTRNALVAATLLVARVAATTLGTSVGASPGQSVVDLNNGATPVDLVTELAGPGISPSDISFTGDPSQAGTFSGMGDIGFDSGIVLSTGQAADVVGPNEENSWTTEFGGPGDPDLSALVSESTQDAAVLSFDFEADTSTVSFRYVFGSEEYPEYVGEFNDVFAFYVNGQNCATVPGSDPAAPVSINSINESMNAEYFRANYYDTPGGAPLDTELDGLTTVLTCTATVTPGEVNTIKLAIADTGDGEYDSAVFIESQSFQAEAPPSCHDSDVTTDVDTAVATPLTVSDPNLTDVHTYTVLSGPDHGTLSGTAPDLVYTPESGYVGSDSFTWTANDGTADCAEAATVTVTVSEPAPPSTVTTTTTPPPSDPPPATPVAASPDYVG